MAKQHQAAQDRLSDIFDHLLTLTPDSIYATMEPQELRNLFLNARDEISDLLHGAESARDEAVEAARSAMTSLELAELNHRDAQSFGWIDRDETAWSLVAQAMCDIDDLIPLSA